MAPMRRLSLRPRLPLSLLPLRLMPAEMHVRAQMAAPRVYAGRVATRAQHKAASMESALPSTARRVVTAERVCVGMSLVRERKDFTLPPPGMPSLHPRRLLLSVVAEVVLLGLILALVPAPRTPQPCALALAPYLCPPPHPARRLSGRAAALLSPPLLGRRRPPPHHRRHARQRPIRATLRLVFGPLLVSSWRSMRLGMRSSRSVRSRVQVVLSCASSWHSATRTWLYLLRDVEWKRRGCVPHRRAVPAQERTRARLLEVAMVVVLPSLRRLGMALHLDALHVPRA